MADEKKPYKVDTRKKCGSWAPGDYLQICVRCGEAYLGDDRSHHCADCAYFLDEAVNNYEHVKAERDALRKELADALKVLAAVEHSYPGRFKTGLGKDEVTP